MLAEILTNLIQVYYFTGGQLQRVGPAAEYRTRRTERTHVPHSVLDSWPRPWCWRCYAAGSIQWWMLALRQLLRSFPWWRICCCCYWDNGLSCVFFFLVQNASIFWVWELQDGIPICSQACKRWCWQYITVGNKIVCLFQTWDSSTTAVNWPRGADWPMEEQWSFRVGRSPRKTPLCLTPESRSLSSTCTAPEQAATRVVLLLAFAKFVKTNLFVVQVLFGRLFHCQRRELRENQQDRGQAYRVL